MTQPLFNNDDARRLLERAAAHAGNPSQLAQALGREARQMQRLHAGKTKTVDSELLGALLGYAVENDIEHELVERLRDAGLGAPAVNPEGQPERADARGIAPVRAEPRLSLPARVSLFFDLPAGLVRIPQVNVEADAGDGFHVDFEEVEGYSIYPEWVIRQEYGVDPARVKEIRTRGSSMQPTIMPGQRLLVALWNGHPLQDGLVYVIHGPGGVQIKRLYIEPEHIHIWSDNPEAPRFRVSLDTWNREYRVLAVALEINRKL